MKPMAIAIVPLMLVAAACTELTDSRETITGSGTVITETRAVDEFERLLIEGMGHAIVEIGPGVSLEIEAEDNVMPRLTTEVRNGRLVIGVEPRTSFRDIEEPVYRITAPTLTDVAISGSGDVEAGPVTGASFEVSISGSGDVIVDPVDVARFEVSISGSGNVEPTGSAEHVEVKISGSGRYDGEGLITTSGSVSVAGSGNAVVNATDALEISIAGSGEVEYLGNPTLNQSIAGSGEIRQR